MNFKSLTFAFGLASVSLVLSACGGIGGSPLNPARGNYTGSFVNQVPNTDSGTLTFTVDDSGNITNGVMTDTTNSANSGTFTGSVDSSENAHVNITIGSTTYAAFGNKTDAAGSTTVFNFFLRQTSGPTFTSSWTNITKH